MSTTIDLHLPELHPGQAEIIASAKRFNCACLGRRAGKTAMGEDLATDKMLDGYPVGWFSPTYKMLTDVWRDMTTTLADVTESRNVAERRLELITGGTLDMWSMDNPDAGRGRKYARVIVDEAAMIKDLMHGWNAALRPTLTDYQGDAWFLSTPKGRNGFWQMWQLGQNEHEPDWMSWQMPTTANPFIDSDEVEAARRQLPERVFLQEFLARFLDDSGGTFRRVMDCATAPELTGPEPDATYIAGVDVADADDFTVVCVMNSKTKALAYMDRFNKVGYIALEDRLAAIYERWNVVNMTIEDNSIGQPVIDHMRARGLHVTPFTTSNASKQPLIQGLQSAFEHDQISILPDRILIDELQAFEGERMASGYRYGAPAGYHDDCVMSLAIAYQSIASYIPARELYAFLS